LANDLEIIHRSIVVRRVDVIQWSEELYERILIDRTIDACKGQVDVVIDFGTTSRSLNRSIQCLSKGGVVFIGHETADRLMPKFARKAEEHHITIQPVELGSLDQLKELVQLVSSGEVKPLVSFILPNCLSYLKFQLKQVQPPPYSVFPAEEASEVISKLCKSQIPGRAILQFHSSAQ
jgi:NADPH:quinone reductase-like Zn-dependent oxidoreductase